MVRAVKTASPLAGPGRRFAGFLLEIVLCLVTLGVGWLAWSVVEWRHGRTPAKRLLRLRVVDAVSADPARWATMALRQGAYAIGIVGLFGAVTLGLGWAVGAAFVLSPTRQAMWDRLAFTTVVHEPAAIAPASESAPDSGSEPAADADASAGKDASSGKDVTSGRDASSGKAEEES